MELTIKIENKNIYNSLVLFLKSVGIAIVEEMNITSTKKTSVKKKTFSASSPKSGLKISHFSFLETQKLLKGYKGSFSNEVSAERRSAV